MSDADPKPWISATGYRTAVQAAHPTHGLSEYRPRCMIHGMPDCSPLLNGCTEAIRQYPAPVPAAPNEHSPEAIAAYPANEWTQAATVAAFREAFDRGMKAGRDAALTEAADKLPTLAGWNVAETDTIQLAQKRILGLRSLQEGNK